MALNFSKTPAHLLKVALLLYCLTPIASFAQTQKPSLFQNGRSLEVGLGYQLQRFKDVRHSSIYRNAGGFSLSIAYRTTNEKRQQVFGLYYSVPSTHQDFVSFAQNLLGGIYYEHLRAVNKNFHFGGYLDLGSFLSIREGDWVDTGANISYAVWSSLGLSASMRHDLGGGWSISPSVRLPILGYTVRPFYGFPYPRTFLKDGRFSFSEEGLANDVLKSGRFQTLNNFMNLQAALGIHRNFGARRHQIGLQFQSNYLFFNGVKPLASWQNQIALSSQFKLNKP